MKEIMEGLVMLAIVAFAAVIVAGDEIASIIRAFKGKR